MFSFKTGEQMAPVNTPDILYMNLTKEDLIMLLLAKVCVRDQGRFSAQFISF